MYMIPYTRRSNSSMMDLFDELERSMFGESGRRTPVFSTDIRDEGAHYLLQADLPGFRKEDIDLDVKDGVLTISAKHQADDRTARRQLHLPGAPHLAASPGPSPWTASRRTPSGPPIRTGCWSSFCPSGRRSFPSATRSRSSEVSPAAVRRSRRTGSA